MSRVFRAPAVTVTTVPTSRVHEIVLICCVHVQRSAVCRSESRAALLNQRTHTTPSLANPLLLSAACVQLRGASQRISVAVSICSMHMSSISAAYCGLMFNRR